MCCCTCWKIIEPLRVRLRSVNRFIRDRTPNTNRDSASSDNWVRQTERTLIECLWWKEFQQTPHGGVINCVDECGVNICLGIKSLLWNFRHCLRLQCWGGHWVRSFAFHSHLLGNLAIDVTFIERLSRYHSEFTWFRYSEEYLLGFISAIATLYLFGFSNFILSTFLVSKFTFVSFM